jgi:hypothetical protein
LPDVPAHAWGKSGGYTPIKGGGIDWVAVTTARMRGWQTRTFVEKTCLHHRKMGTASRSRLMARFQHGQEDYYGRTSTLAGFCGVPSKLRNYLCLRTLLDPRLFLGHGKADAETSVARAYRFSPG